MTRLEHHAARLRRGLTILFAATALMLLLERLGYAGLYEGQGTAGAIGQQLVLAIPALISLAALWQLRCVAAQVAAAAPFALAAARGLHRAGVMLIISAALTIVAAPVLYEVLAKPYPRLIDSDVTTLISGAIGAAMVMLARLIDRARSIENELNEIF